MQRRCVDVLTESPRHRDLEDHQCHPLQRDTDDSVHRHADQALGQLIGAGVDGGDGDDGQRHIHCGGQNHGVGAAVDEH